MVSEEDYVATMRSSSEWGGPLEIAVCSHKRRAAASCQSSVGREKTSQTPRSNTYSQTCET